jgi:protein SCO1/2
VEARPRYAVSEARLEVPDVTLLDAWGRPQALRALVAGEEPVALNFIFTTCTTICPVMTATFAQMRRELGGAESKRLRLVSISIDPEQDRPEVLRRYAELHGAAGEGWSFLTGEASEIERVQRALGAYSGSKMSHRPLTLLRRAHGESWVRLEGLASGAALADEVRRRLLDD